MSKKSKCSCGKHENRHHNDMTQSELISHVKECLTNAIEKLECIKEVVDKITIEE